jgi:acylphosphatase
MSGQGREHRSEERARSGAPRGSESRTSTRRAVAVVSGHVQGVGYRYFVRGLAFDAGLAGSARNLPDGRVEVVLEGDDASLGTAIAALSGPEAPGSVSRVDVRHEPAQGSTGFTVQ